MISLTVFPSPSSFYASFLASSFVTVKPLVSLPSFSHFAEVSSPFLQLAMCFFSGSSKKSKEQEEETPLQEADTGFLFLFFFLIFTGVDTGVRDPELVILEGAVGSVQAASLQTA